MSDNNVTNSQEPHYKHQLRRLYATVKWLVLGVLIGIIIGASAVVSFGVVMAASYISQAIHPLKEVEKSAAGEYNSIDISLRVSDIDIVPSSDGSTKATCYERDNYYHEVVVEDNTLKVRMVDKRSFIAKLFYPGMKLTLEVPQKEYVSFKEPFA